MPGTKVPDKVTTRNRLRSARRAFEFNQSLWLPIPPAELFPFFADAHNLESITPPWLRFRVLTAAPIVMGEGTLIDYRLRLHGMPIRWRTRISVWEPPYRFVDEQLRGPYRAWIHTHTFEPLDRGTLCRDRVEYAVPGGTLIHDLFVKRQVQRIFQYRREFLRTRFASDGAHTAA